MLHTLLIVEDEKHTRDGLVMALEDNYDIYEASNVEEAMQLLSQEPFDVVLTDLRMGSSSGMAVIEKLKTLPNRPVGIMMTAYGDVDTAVEAMKRGAFDFLTKPVDLARLEAIIKQGLRLRKAGNKIKQEEFVAASVPSKNKDQTGLIGDSSALKKVWDDLLKVSPSKATVLLYGETGTGKELFARQLHDHSPRKDKPFMAVHCASLSENLLESELFGHEKGAFTGAIKQKAGRFELADQGTLFLDEIAEIDAPTQVKLLRFLESKQFERVGGTQTLEVDVRLVCATNKDLQKLVDEGTFREDLYYRLNVVTLDLPPLRERKGDIPKLTQYYLDTFAKDNNVEPPKLDSKAMQILEDYDWPGNIRELRNLCERMVVMNPEKTLTDSDMDPKLTVPILTKPSLTREDQEKQAIHNALKAASGNRTKAAEILGISRRTLHRKLTQWPELDL